MLELLDDELDELVLPELEASEADPDPCGATTALLGGNHTSLGKCAFPRSSSVSVGGTHKGFLSSLCASKIFSSGWMPITGSCDL